MPHSHFHIRKAGQIINAGGIIAYPTEAVYGLGCHPQSISGLKRLLNLKKRSWKKGLILVASDVEQVIPYLSEQAFDLLDCFDQEKSYPVTWLLPVNPSVSSLLVGEHNKIAIRLSNNPFVKALCTEAKSALVSTSANRSGQLAFKTACQTRNKMFFDIDQIVAGSVGDYAKPSAIIDAQTQQVLRPY